MLIAAMCVGWVANAQSLGDYTYSTGVDATKWIAVSSSTNLLGTGNADSRASSLQSIGFTFPFAGGEYTQYSVNSDGNLRLGTPVTGTSNYGTPFSSSNASANSPKINFLGCDGYFLDTIHYVYAENTVDANNDSLLVVEFCLGTYNSTTRDQRYKWQVHLYPNGNIEVVMASTAPVQAPNTSNQKGLCADAGDGWVIASDNTATHFTAGSSTTWASGTWPAPNTYYRFVRPVVTCPQPTAITMHSLTPTAATLTFTPGGTETAWHGTITPGIMGYSDITLADTTVNLMFLTPNTDYTVTVRAICGAGDSSFVTSLSFHTPCTPMALPYANNFDDVTTSTTSATGVMPSCWTIGHHDNPTTAAQEPQIYYGASNASSGSYSLRLYNNCYTALPLFQTPVDSLMMRFQLKQTASSYIVVVGVMDNPFNPATFVPVDTLNCSSTSSFEYQEVFFDGYTGNGQYIAFHNITTPNVSYAYSYNYIDDLEVMLAPTCRTPREVAVSNIGSSNATLSWTGNSTSYMVAYGSDTTDMSTVVSNTNSITLTDLQPSTTYYVMVKALCSATDESEFSLLESFTTMCDPFTIPYSLDFDDLTTSTTAATGVMPNCWTIGHRDVTMSAAQSPQVYYSTSNAHSGSYSLRLYYRGYVALPLFQTPVDSLMLKFWLKQTSASYLLEVGVMTDPNDASTFVPVDTINNTSTSAYEYKEILFNNYTGNGQYIAFHNITTNTYNYSYNYIDDLQVTLLPTCFTPQNVAASNVDAHSATISWTGNASNYVVVCGDDTMNVTGNSITLTGLLASTTYSVSVKAVCSATDESDFSTPISFTTLCEAIALPYIEDFDNLSGNLPNCWTKIGAGTAAKYSSTTYAHSGNYSLRFNGATSNLVALPEMDAPTNTLTMSFWTRPESFTNSNCGTFSVGYVTDVTDANSFVALETYTYSDFTEIENKVVSFASAPATATIALRHTPNSTAWYWFVDDIEVSVSTPECVATTWITGDSTGSSYYTPVNNYYKYTLSETIITAEEIGGPMRIDTISFHYMYSSPMTDKFDVTMWLQPTTKSEFSSTSDIDLLDSSIAVQIFSDSMNFSQGWNDIVLPTPYIFDGTTNLMLIVDDNSNDYNSSSYKFSTANCSDYKTITWYSDSQNPDPVTGNNSLTGSAFSNNKTRYQYRVRMALKGCDLSTCHKPNDLAASNVTPYSVNLTWSNNNSNNTTYTIVNLVDSTIVNTGVTAGSHIINGLTPETSYAFGVYANCSADDSSIMATVTFATPATCVMPTDFTCTGLTFTSATLTWTDNSNSNASYTIYDLSDTSVVATGITGTTYTVNGLTAETNYTFGLMADCSATDHSDMTTVSIFTGYCIPTPSSVDGSGITSVSFGGMTNTTHPTSAGYANYSSMSGSVPAGTTATVDITYATGYTYGTIIWVDWNNNMLFEGNEVVYVGESSSSNPTTLTATFDIPATQTLGNYRMRILGADSYFDSYTSSIAAAANANPCASYSWGVAEDYTLTVTTMPDCLPITGLTATANSYSSVTLSWTDANNTGATYTVYDMSDSSVVATGITGTTYTATGLTPNTYYTFGVAANCSATDASNVVTVSVHTPCVAVAVPFYESFDTNSATLGCWTAYSMNDANTVSLSIFNTNGIALRFSSYYSASDYNQYAFSPVFNYTGTDSTLQFSVQYATYGSSDQLYFGYITPTDTVWTTNSYTTTGQSDVQTYTASIPANATQIAFHYYGDYAYYAWVDSVSVTEAPAAITMTIASADLTMGTTNPVPGTYTYQVGDTITVTAVPNTGYNFDYWVLSMGALTDTITLSTYTGVVPAIVAGATFNLVAHFTPAQFNVTLATADVTMGTTIPAPGTYSYYPGDTLTIAAVPATNCHFVQWNDGDTNATRLITVTGNATYTAIFDYNPITVTLVNADATMGSITPTPGIYTFHVGDTAIAQATPATGYHFNQWMINMAGLTDSMPNNPVTMILPTYLAGASITMTATYAPNLYSIDVYANDNTLGTVTGTGQYAYNSYATITATPAEHCIFVQWNDGDTNAVRNVLVTGNASYTATFQAIPQHEVTLTVDPENSGSVTGAGLYYEGESVTITATPNEGYHFLGWGLEEATDFDYVIFSHDLTYTFTMGETNKHYYAVFEEDATPATLHIRYDSYAGTVFINDVESNGYDGFVGDTVTLRAVANDGFRFVNWVGEGVENPTSATITYVILAAETEIEVNFEQLEGIIDVDGSIITIYSANNNIIVRGAEQQTIRVFDVVGRLVAQRTNANDEETIAMTNTGVYLVKVGDAPARRVVVRR